MNNITIEAMNIHNLLIHTDPRIGTVLVDNFSAFAKSTGAINTSLSHTSAALPAIWLVSALLLMCVVLPLPPGPQAFVILVISLVVVIAGIIAANIEEGRKSEVKNLCEESDAAMNNLLRLFARQAEELAGRSAVRDLERFHSLSPETQIAILGTNPSDNAAMTKLNAVITVQGRVIDAQKAQIAAQKEQMHEYKERYIRAETTGFDCGPRFGGKLSGGDIAHIKRALINVGPNKMAQYYRLPYSDGAVTCMEHLTRIFNVPTEVILTINDELR